MKKINLSEIREERWSSPAGKYEASSLLISEAHGRDPQSLDLDKRHPFDVELAKIPPGKTLCPYHSHSAQWEFYIVVSGKAQVRHEDGTTEVGPGDTFLFRPGEAHALHNDGPEEFVYYIVADNPIGESCYYPDSGKWAVHKLKERRVVRGSETEYFDGEEPGGSGGGWVQAG